MHCNDLLIESCHYPVGCYRMFLLFTNLDFHKLQVNTTAVELFLTLDTLYSRDRVFIVSRHFSSRVSLPEIVGVDEWVKHCC